MTCFLGVLFACFALKEGVACMHSFCLALPALGLLPLCSLPIAIHRATGTTSNGWLIGKTSGVCCRTLHVLFRFPEVGPHISLLLSGKQDMMRLWNIEGIAANRAAANSLGDREWANKEINAAYVCLPVCLLICTAS